MIFYGGGHTQLTLNQLDMLLPWIVLRNFGQIFLVKLLIYNLLLYMF